MALDLETDYILSKFKEIKLLSSARGKNVFVVMESNTNKLYIKKSFDKNINLDIYHYMKAMQFNNIPKIHYILEDVEYNYVIEDFVSGTPLEIIIGNNTNFSSNQIILWVICLCKILRQLHDSQPPIIHRDIKPSNIIIVNDTSLKLIDFDISRTYKDEPKQDTCCFGTEYYAAPEQYGFAQTDNRSDIYAIGKLMIVLLTKRKTPLDEIYGQYGHVGDIVRKCCQIDPANRYQNVTELLRALQPIIFDGLSKLNNDDIIAQIATLETMTMLNMSKPYAQKVGKGIVKTVNLISKTLGKSELKEPTVTDIWDMVTNKAESMKQLSRSELDTRLIKILIKKSGIWVENEYKQDIVSSKVIDEAAKVFNIPNNLTSAQKADCIFNRYSERMIENLQKVLKNQDSDTANKTNEALQSNIDDMNESQREQLKKVLNIDKLTADTVRGALIKAGAPAAILTTISAAGFGSYLALTTIIHAIATTALGITLPFAFYTSATSFLSVLLGPLGIMLILGVASLQIFSGGKKLDRELLAQIVWLSVSSYGNKFALEDVLNDNHSNMSH